MARGGRRAFLFLAEQRSSDSVLGQATRVRLRASPRARGEVVLKPNGTAHRGGEGRGYPHLRRWHSRRNGRLAGHECQYLGAGLPACAAPIVHPIYCAVSHSCI